jgi:integrase
LSKYYSKPKRGSTSKKTEKRYEQVSSRLSIYIDDRTKKQNWIARILMEDGSYKIRSTKTNNKNLAVRRALDIFDDLKLRERHHLPFKDASAQKVLDYWLKNDGSRLTPRRQKAVARWFEFVFQPFLIHHCSLRDGLGTTMQRITPQMLKAYAGWRINENSIEILRQFALKKNEGKPERPHYNRRLPSRNTLALEIGNYNVVARVAARNSIIDKAELMPTLSKTFVDLTAVKAEVRPSINTFTDAQVAAISKLLARYYIQPDSRWNRGICKLDDEGNGVRGEDGAIRSKKGMYMTRVNIYASWFILKNTGMRLSELHSLKWKDIKKELVELDSEGRERNIYLLRVNETKPYRIKKAMVPKERIVVAPQRLESIFDLIKRENPKFCSDDDFVINYKGKKRSSQQELFKKLLAAPKTWHGKPIDCTQHDTGTPLQLRHLRSWYVSDRLINKSYAPHLLTRQTGHSLDTVLKYYLTNRPKKTQMRLFGGWGEVSESLVRDEMMAAL